MASNPFSGPERFYVRISPPLAARIRQLWSSRGLDLDRIWGECVGGLPGLATQSDGASAQAMRSHDGLCLFDQALIWLIGLNRICQAGQGVEGLALTQTQLSAIAALSGRMQETLGALRLLVLEGYTTPALQLARSVSEDVDMTLALLLRPRLAADFVACRTSDEANDFWRRHIAGGRAFRFVAEKLYAIGLDHTDGTHYGRWRREVLTLLGSAIHSSPLGRSRGAGRGGWTEDPMARDCLEFVTYRLHELCAWAHLLELRLTEDLTRIATAAGPAAREARLLRYAVLSRDILLDQLRWSLRGREDPAGADLLAGPPLSGGPERP